MIYHERSGTDSQYTVCSISGPFGDPRATYEAWYYRECLAVGCRTPERAREICREHARKQRVAA